MGRRAPTKRKSIPRTSKKRVLLVVEGSPGKSEVTYFQRLNQELRGIEVGWTIKVIPGEGEPAKVLRRCKTELGRDHSFDLICLVVDADSHPALQRTIIECQKNIPPIHVLVTNPQFELWLLWHVEDQHAYISSADLMDRVCKRKLTCGKGNKTLAGDFPIGRIMEAVERAEKTQAVIIPSQIGPNPSSAIPWLIRTLMDFGRQG